jgi:hypothetical protein
MIFPLFLDKNMNILAELLTQLKKPVLKFNIGIKGMGDSFSFIIKDEEKWNISSYLTTYLSMGVFLYFITCN